MATFGTIAADCPICGRRLHIPVTAAGPIQRGPGAIGCRIELDRDYLEAHALTHVLHDGDPILAAVA